MPQGTLANLATSAFVRTPPALAERLVRCLLAFPHARPTTVLDPTAGEGDLLAPCRDLASVRLYGVEISAERAAVARERLPHADIVTSAFEGVSIAKASMSLVLANPPYFFQDGRRAEYRILADAGTLLRPGGVLVAIVPARSAWDGTMINHWARWYDQVRVWKFPDRSPVGASPRLGGSGASGAEDTGAFEDYTQMCVVGIRRAEPVEPSPAEQRRLQGYRYHTAAQVRSSTASRGIRAGWVQGTPPPDLPTVPIPHPYAVPEATMRPQIVVRYADEARLLAALEQGGAHFAPLWQAATEWREEGLRESPVMPLSGDAHVAAEVLTGLLDGEIVTFASTIAETTPQTVVEATTSYLFTAFVGQEWVPLPIDAEEREKLRERGVAHVSARQWQDKPMLGILNLHTGETQYKQGEAVFTFLQPWLSTLAARVIEKRQPVYCLDPADWELRVVAAFGQDKQLPHAPFPGLSVAQQHRVYAMGRALDESGRTAIQGEPGTGKTRLGVATAARMAYRWRHRTRPLVQSSSTVQAARATMQAQPAWIRGLRQAWLKNPRTLALLDLTPVREAQTGRIMAYRHADGTIMAPQDAGPQALPVLVSTPKKVTKEYAQEIRVAWPEAEVVRIERHTDVARWLAQCATSAAPAVIGIVSHSLTRAFGRAWQPAVHEKQVACQVPVLDPEKDLLPRLEPVQDAHGVLTGYRWKQSGELYCQEQVVTHFWCPGCGAPVKAVPGTLHEVERPHREDREGENPVLFKPRGQAEDGDDMADDHLAVTSRTWFTLKPRWCRCRTDARNRPGPHTSEGRRRVRTPLWSDARVVATQRKQPQLSFAQWHEAVCAQRTQPFVKDLRLGAARPERRAVSLRRAVPLAGGTDMHPPTEAEPHYVACVPLPASFSPYDYLHRFYRGCVALTIVDESHNGRGRDTDIAHAHHQAMLAAQTRMLTSGTHFGGDVLSFYHYWFRFHPQFWRRLGLGWDDAEKALERYGVIQEWTKEYESDARRGSGQTSVQVSTIAAPGLSAKLIPYLLEDMVYLTVLDVGAHMPPRREIPEIVSMRDAQVEDARDAAAQARKEATRRLAACTHAQCEQAQCTAADAQVVTPVPVTPAPVLATLHETRPVAPASAPRGASGADGSGAEQERLQQVVADAMAYEQAVSAWAQARDLAWHYHQLVSTLDELAQQRNMAAQLAKGTVPRWFAALPCDRPFEVWQTTRDTWGDARERTLLVSTQTLAWQHVYPLEQRLLTLVQRERAEGRRVMVYFEQNDLRSMARRLEWVLHDLHPWTLPNSVAAEERQQAILQAVQQGHAVVLVPYRRVNEGLNLQSGIDTIIWVEMALNLFLLDQASRRAWRLGKREEVRIYYLTYAYTVGHHKLRKLGQQSGAAAAFAGEPARGALIEHAGADKTTLARLSHLLDQQEGEEEAHHASWHRGAEREVAQEEADLKAVFAQRADELRAALQRGRTWLGNLSDTLTQRLASLYAAPSMLHSVWQEIPPPLAAPHAPVLSEQGDMRAPLTDSLERTRAEAVAHPAETVAVPIVPANVPHEERDTYTVPMSVPVPVSQEEASTIGTRAAVIFGRSEHIALVRVPRRPRRRHGNGTGRPRHMSVTVRDIASINEEEACAVQTRQACEVPVVVERSLWEVLDAQSEETESGNRTAPSVSPLFASPLRQGQPVLWEPLSAPSSGQHHV